MSALSYMFHFCFSDNFPLKLVQSYELELDHRQWTRCGPNKNLDLLSLVRALELLRVHRKPSPNWGDFGQHPKWNWFQLVVPPYNELDGLDKDFPKIHHKVACMLPPYFQHNKREIWNRHLQNRCLFQTYSQKLELQVVPHANLETKCWWSWKYESHAKASADCPNPWKDTVEPERV